MLNKDGVAKMVWEFLSLETARRAMREDYRRDDMWIASVEVCRDKHYGAD
jgi:hypothetical protein